MICSVQTDSGKQPALPLKDIVAGLPNKLRELLASNLKDALSSATFSPAALARWPMLAQKEAFAAGVLECIRIEKTDDFVLLGVDRALLEQKHWPRDLHARLEFGDDVLPPCPFLRKSVVALKGML